MTTLRCNNCTNYDVCPDAGEVWWAECPWWDGTKLLQADRVQEYGDKLDRGCSCGKCDNCALMDTGECRWSYLDF